MQLDKAGRITIFKEIREHSNLEEGKRLLVCKNGPNKFILVPETDKAWETNAVLFSAKPDEKGRVAISPKKLGLSCEEIEKAILYLENRQVTIELR